LVDEAKPAQCTLVPDAPDARTSDHGWDLDTDGKELRPIIEELRSAGFRVSLFLDPDPAQIARARALGADRIELATESYARAFATEDECSELSRFAGVRIA
jgi:pyridoxine 5-phosphate synthase